MFERFTDRARRVVVLAQEESRLLNHNYIGTEHILLGLVHEGEGVAAKTLEALDISLAAIRVKVEEVIGHGGQSPSGHIPFTPRAKKVLEMSFREALQLGHDYIGTEHILLGLIREGEGVGAQVLVKLGADLDRVRQQVIQTLSGYSEMIPVPPRMPQPIPSGGGIRPAACSFCSTPSPQCGPLFAGDTGALICARCVGAATGGQRAQVGTRLMATSQRESIEVRAARHEPSGPPPDDEDAARRAIEDAFSHPMEVGGDGRTLINVEDGAALATCGEEIRSRVGQFLDQSVNVVDHIKFLNATEAVVWSTVLINGRPPIPALNQSEGRAVLVDGRWKVARQTMCQRWAHAGVICPPPAST